MAIMNGRDRRRYPARPAVSAARETAAEKEQAPEVPGAVGAGAWNKTLEIHFKLFGTDGVSLQSQELSQALRLRGWSVLSCAYDVPPGAAGLRLPELSYQSPDAIALRQRIFSAASGASLPVPDGAALVAEITERARVIRRRIEDYVDAQRISLLHIRNLMSLPYHLPATLAVYNLAVDRPDIGFVMQHHDLYWEGPNARNFRTPHRQISDLMDRIMCPSLPNTRHVLINPLAAEALHAKKGLDGTVIPDGFDFGRHLPPIDELAFRGKLQVLAGDPKPVGAGDLVVAMPARVAINKAIELAIQFVARLNRDRAALQAPGGLGLNRRRFGADSSVVLLLPQGEDLQDNRQYFDMLVAYARHCRVKLAYGGDIVVPDRRMRPGDPDRYPFYGTYQAADLICYPPEHEGFGNQAIETVWAKRPLAVLEYPVFRRFVRHHIPHFISLGDTEQLRRLSGKFAGLHQLRDDVLDAAVKSAIALLRDHDLEKRWEEENFTVLRAFCGIDTVAAQYLQLYAELKGNGRP